MISYFASYGIATATVSVVVTLLMIWAYLPYD
jgi:hypothetical protein